MRLSLELERIRSAFNLFGALGAALIARIAEAKEVGAVPLLVALASCPTPYAGNKRHALEALRSVGGAAVAEAIVLRLTEVVDTAEVPWDPYHPTLFVQGLLEVLFAVDDTDPYARLAPLFAPERVATPSGARVVKDVVSAISGRFSYTAHAVMPLLSPDRAPAVRFRDDARWLERFVRLLGDRRLRQYAKFALKGADPMPVAEATERVVGAPVKPKPVPHPSEEAMKRATEGARARATVLRAAFERALVQLKAHKYSPRAGNKSLTSVDARAAEVRLDEIEKLIKSPLPTMVRAAYLVVGPIDFQRPLDKSIPPGIEAFAASPRLQIVPLDRALKAVRARLRDNVGIPGPLRSPIALELSDDDAVLLEPWCEDPRMESADCTLSEFLRGRIDAWAIPGVGPVVWSD